jgi:hypothetical protein
MAVGVVTSIDATKYSIKSNFLRINYPTAKQDSKSQSSYYTALKANVIVDSTHAATILSSAIIAADKVKNDIDCIPSGKNILISEYGLYNKNKYLKGTWLEQLSAGIMTLKFLEQNRISKIIYTIQTKEPNNILDSLSASIKGKTYYQRLIFDNAPIIVDSKNDDIYFGLMGYCFTSSTKKEIVLMNLAAQPISVDVSMNLKNTSRTCVQYFAKPNATTKQVQKVKGKCSSIIQLPAYSITRIF